MWEDSHATNRNWEIQWHHQEGRAMPDFGMTLGPDLWEDEPMKIDMIEHTP